MPPGSVPNCQTGQQGRRVYTGVGESLSEPSPSCQTPHPVGPPKFILEVVKKIITRATDLNPWPDFEGCGLLRVCAALAEMGSFQTKNLIPSLKNSLEPLRVEG